eukprot:c12541_g1_i2.p1 GENE.c12541_g1_i2~~c12541_g1_i2.p1  ORF type:complete len:114 (-),score=13.56 c12541_g1_i2:93-434(-)
MYELGSVTHSLHLEPEEDPEQGEKGMRLIALRIVSNKTNTGGWGGNKQKPNTKHNQSEVKLPSTSHILGQPPARDSSFPNKQQNDSIDGVEIPNTSRRCLQESIRPAFVAIHF